MLVFAILVGFITDMMADFMESIVTGRSKVSETGHTLVLGARIPVLKLTSLNSVPVDITIASSPQHTGLQARDLPAAPPHHRRISH